MIKKMVGVAIFVFWAVTTAMLTAGLLLYQNGTAGTLSGFSSGQQTGSGQNVTDIVLNASEIAKHNSIGDCWLIINNKVYDVTNYLSVHPGGSATTAPYCGGDGTAAFGSKDKTPPQTHSGTADTLLNAYYIGDLNQKISSQNVQQPPPNPPGAGSGDDEYEDEDD